jgi:hypothetical protein
MSNSQRPNKSERKLSHYTSSWGRLLTAALSEWAVIGLTLPRVPLHLSSVWFKLESEGKSTWSVQTSVRVWCLGSVLACQTNKEVPYSMNRAR